MLFFTLDYEDEPTVEFRQLLLDVETACMVWHPAAIRKFIALSRFVDGYFAEDYFISVEKIIQRNAGAFCKELTAIESIKKQRLVDYWNNLRQKINGRRARHFPLCRPHKSPCALPLFLVLSLLQLFKPDHHACKEIRTACEPFKT